MRAGELQLAPPTLAELDGLCRFQGVASNWRDASLMKRDKAGDRLRRHVVIIGILITGAGFIAASETLHDKVDALVKKIRSFRK